MDGTVPPRYVPTVRAAAATASVFALPMAIVSVMPLFDTHVPPLAPHYYFFYPLLLGGLMTVVAMFIAFVFVIIGHRATASRLLLLVLAGWLGGFGGCLAGVAVTWLALWTGAAKR